MSPPASPSPSYEELAALVVDLTSQLQRAHGRIAELEARLGRDSTNSSQPPSADSIAIKARRRVDRSSRERSADRKPGGQPGHKGSGLAPSTEPDRTETVAAPAECAGCGENLGEAVDAGMGWAQVWDLPPITLEKVHYLLPRRRCGCWPKTTTAVPPFGAARNVVYGPKRERRGDPAGHRGQCACRADRDADGGVAFRPGVDRVRCPRRGPLRPAPGRGRVRRGDG